MPPGTCQIPSSARTPEYQQSKKKSADSAPITIVIRNKEGVVRNEEVPTSTPLKRIKLKKLNSMV
jgi:hypothetical protein